MNECRVVITDETGHEMVNITADTFEDISPQENVVIVLNHAFSTAVLTLPKKRREEIKAEMDAELERKLDS